MPNKLLDKIHEIFSHGGARIRYKVSLRLNVPFTKYLAYRLENEI